MRTIDKSEAGEKKVQQQHPALRHVILAALSALGAGLVASLCAVLVMSFLRLVAGIPSPVELFGDHILKNISVDHFIQLLNRFKPNSKTAPLGLTLLAMIAVGTTLGLLYALVVRVQVPAASGRPSRKEWLIALGLALAMTLAGALLFWSELAQNFYGMPLEWAAPVTLLGLPLDFASYALVLCRAYRVVLPEAALPAGE